MWTVFAEGMPNDVQAAIRRQAATSDDHGARASVGSVALLVAGLRLEGPCVVRAQGGSGGPVHIELRGRLKGPARGSFG
jgi:hypothetical protein